LESRKAVLCVVCIEALMKGTGLFKGVEAKVSDGFELDLGNTLRAMKLKE
jgi:hypothetical protein